jgi:dTDP-4-amino-4,6-dideoxygalactose transaminase
MKIPIAKPFFDECELNKVVEPLQTGWVVQGPNVKEFEQMFAAYTGSKFASATSNCTTALHLALLGLGIGTGDKVIIPSFTYVATANAVEYTGGEIIFCDIDLRTFNIDETKLEELVQKDRQVKAIMPVNLFGLCANLPEIIKIARKYSLKVIEDSACGFDAWIGEKHSGTFGDAGCFSFHPRKSICTGEGGMLITDDEAVATKVSQLKDHGASKSDLQRHIGGGGSLLPDFTMRGYNYRMTDIQGVLGVCQLKKADIIMQAKRKIARQYDDALKSVKLASNVSLGEFLIPPYIPENFKHGYQSYVCIFTGGEDITNLSKEKIDRINKKRNQFMFMLEDSGIATRQGTHAVHTLTYYKNKYKLQDADFLMSYAADRLSIALPLYPEMTDQEFEYVIDKMSKALIDMFCN